MRLFFGNTETGQKINNRFGLHFQFAGQLIDSDLVYVAHALRLLLGPVTPALPLLLVPLRFRFPLPELRPARLRSAPSLLQQRPPHRRKLLLPAALLQQFPSSPLPQPLQLRPLRRLRLQLPGFPRSLRFHRLARPQKRSHKTGSPTGRSCPPSFRRCPESPSTVPASSKPAFPPN